ncbi:MAG: hypothetical protein ACKO4A_15370, partial [Gammaproteobacteria bacterium]
MASGSGGLRQIGPRVGLTLLLLGVFAVAFVVYGYSEKRIDRANDVRLESYELAHELQQSSEDLTTMARAFVTTRDTAYRDYFRQILEIRDGRRTRPPGYEHQYWNMVAAGKTEPPGMEGESRSLLERMRAAGFKPEEMQLIELAKQRSDDLALIENEAMGTAATSSDPAALEIARRRVYDQAYHDAKGAIMAPLAELQQRVHARTDATVQAAERTALLMQLLVALLGLLVIYLVFSTYRITVAMLGAPVDLVRTVITRIGKGDFQTPVPNPGGHADSVMSWLETSRDALARLEVER